MYDEKDWIALECCPLCSKERGIAINQRMSKTLPKKVSMSFDLCDDCLKKAKEEGWFIVWEVDAEDKRKPKPTGRYLRINIEAVNPNNEDFYQKVDKDRVCLATLEEFGYLLEYNNNHKSNESEGK